MSDQRPGQAAESTGCCRRCGACRCVTSRAAASSAPTRTWPSKKTPTSRCRLLRACRRSRPAVSSTDCWFGGAALPSPLVGSFHLHWNGSTVTEAPYMNQGDPVAGHAGARQLDLRERRIQQAAPPQRNRIALPPAGPARRGRRNGGLRSARRRTARCTASENEPPEALQALRLGSTEGVLWAAAGKQIGIGGLTKEQEGQVTVIRRVDGIWTQLFGGGEAGGPAHPLPRLLESEAEEDELLGGPAAEAEVRAIAPEPGTEDAWLALAPQRGTQAAETAVLVHISAQGEVLGVQALPSRSERELRSRRSRSRAAARSAPGPKTAGWPTSTAGSTTSPREGERTLPASELPGFPEGKIVTERPARRRRAAGSHRRAAAPTPRGCRKKRRANRRRSKKRAKRNPKTSSRCRCSATCTRGSRAPRCS